MIHAPRKNLAKRIPALIIALAILLVASMHFARAAEKQGSGERGEILDRTLIAVAQNYYDPDRIAPQEMLGGALDEIQLGIPEMLVTNRDGAKLGVTVGLASKQITAKPMSNLADLSRTMLEVLGFTLAHYSSDEDTPPEEVEYTAAEGMLRSLDPHSGFLPPKVYKEFKIGTKGNFGGLGIVISIKDGMLTVIAPIDGTPASAAGIMAGDRILQIDDESTINMSLTDAVNKLRGDVGSKVTIALETPGRPVRKLSLTRALINIESVKSTLLSEDGKRIGFLRIKNFQSNTDDDVEKALADFHKDGAKLDGLIIDMRNNPGGLLNVAVDVANRFMRQGIIVTTVGPRNKIMDVDEATGVGTEPNYPIVVLMNEGSASAAEIVAGALALNNRAVTAGQRSFGKGSVQTIIEVGEGAAIKLTIAQYKPAGRQSIQVRGIAPDIALIPSTVVVDEVNIVEDKPMTEKDLDHAIAEEKIEGGPLSEPKFRIHYSSPKRDEKWLEQRSQREYSKDPDLAGDFEVELARKLIAQAGDAGADEMLKKAASVIKSLQEEQHKAIANELAKLGIDWKKAPANGKPSIAISHRLTRGGQPIQRAKAGDKLKIEISATNSGKGSASQLIAVGESETSYLEGLEFPFGRLDPGQTRSFSVPVEIPEGEPSAIRIMKLKFDEANGNAPVAGEITLQVDELPYPAFSFEMKLPTLSQGRPMPKGASIPMSVDVANTGKGTSSEETVVTLSNECGEKVFIERGRSKVGALAPGAKKRVSFSFHITDGEDGEDGCAVKLSIVDLKRLAILSKNVELAIANGTTKPAADRAYGPPTIELEALAKTTDAQSVNISGTVKDSDPVRDCFVFVKDRKVAYVPNSEESDSMSFSVNVPLEEGSNNIIIGARDMQDITARKMVVVERRKAKPASDNP